MERAKKQLEGPKEQAVADPISQSLPPAKSQGHVRATPVPAKKPQVIMARVVVVVAAVAVVRSGVLLLLLLLLLLLFNSIQSH